MTDQTPTPADPTLGLSSVLYGGSWRYHSNTRLAVETFVAEAAAAGFRVERVPDDQTVAEAESLIERLRESVEAVPGLFPDGEPEDACDITDAAAWRMERAADLIERAFLPEGDRQ